MRPIIIDKEEIKPGEYAVVNTSVSRLPSGTRITMQAHVFRSQKEGPTILIMAGVHGDEINGIEIVRRTLTDGIYHHLKIGTAIVIPLLNVFGFINFSREVPDGKDVNRSFPGTRTGSLASRVASVLTKKILPNIDYAIDLHTGGSSRYNFPQIRYSKKDSRAKELAKSFGAPFIIQKPLISKSFRKTANEMGASVMVYEAGESERLDGFSIELGYNGILRVLKALGMSDYAPEINHQMYHMRSTGWIRASEAGIFTWSRQSGTKIRRGEALGTIFSPQGDRIRKIVAKKDGYIIGHNNASVVHNGDALFHVAYDYERI